MSSSVNLLKKFEELEENADKAPVTDILEEVKEDTRTITAESASKGLAYLRELEENWSHYDEVDWFHGTKSINIEQILEEGLIPGEDNESATGERTDHGEVCLGPFTVALSYAKNGTARPDQVQAYVEQAYDVYLGEDEDIPDITTVAGREEFSEDTENINWWGGWNALPKAVENYKEIVEASKSDPIIVGTNTDGMVNPDEDAYERKGIKDSEIYSNDEISGDWFEVGADSVNPEDISIFVPHEKLDDYRDEYGDRATILSIEAMQMKVDNKNQDFYEEHGTIRYDEVWNPEGEYAFALGSELGPYASSPLIPSTSE